ncbi:MAG: hypothetical protein ACPGSI_12175 [Pikeienuella sp.]
MKIGATVSGGAHVVLIGLAIFAGDLFAEDQSQPVPIAEVELMSGAEFEAAQSVAPDFNPDLPSAPKAPEPGDERADIKIAEENAAPARAAIAADPTAPKHGDDVTPLEAVPTPDLSLAEIGEQPSAPPAPEGDVLIAAPPTADGSARVAAIVPIPTPAPRPERPSSAASLPDTAPAAPPEPEPEVAPEPEPSPEPGPEVAAVEPPPEVKPEPVEPPKPEPAPEPEVTKLNDPDETAPTLAPAPPRKPKDVADAKKAQRLAAAAEAAKTGATQQAETSQGGGTSRTVGNLSFRDKDALRLGIKGNFNPPQGMANANQLSVVIRVQLSADGKIVGKPELRQPRSPSAAHRALAGAGMRALLKSAAKGVFKRLPKDKHAKWRLIDVTFTPKEIQFL